MPIVEKISGGVKVKVGSVAHPMEEKHYIEWIEVIADGRVLPAIFSAGGKNLKRHSRLRPKRLR